MIDFLRDWLSEKSTWIGIFTLLTAFNVNHLTPGQQSAITAVGIGLVARHERKS